MTGLRTVSFAGCSNKEADKSKSNELVLFNAKGENEAEFEEMCKAFTEETGIPTKLFSTCNGTNSLSIDPAYIGHLKGEVDIESVVSVIEKIFVPNHFPTAIFCCSDEVAIELMCWLMHHGYKIPEDVSVLSFDGIPYTEKLNPSMTTICQPVEFQAERIINGMLYLLDGKERKSDDTGNDYVLQIRDSTGVPRE